MNKILILTLILIPFLWVSSAFATSPSVSPKKVLELSLKKSILLALKNNFEIQISRLAPEISGKNIAIAESAFDPFLSLSASVDNDRQLSLRNFAGSGTIETEIISLNGSAEKKFSPGTNVSVGIQNTRVYSNNESNLFNPYIKTDLYLGFDQPLLRGFGKEINEMPIVIASNNQLIDKYKFEEYVLEITFEVHNIYWNLISYAKQLEVNLLLLKKAEILLENNKEKVKVGIMTPIEVLQAEVEVSKRQEEIIKSQHKICEFENQLKKIINISEKSKYWSMKILPTEKPLLPNVVIDEKAIIKSTLKKRSELKQQDLVVQNLRNQILLAENDTLPSLNFQVKGTLHGLGENAGENLDRITSGSFHELNIGVVLTYPLYNRETKSLLFKKKLELEREKTRLAKMKNDIVFEVLDIILKLGTEKKRISVTQKTIKLEKERLAMEEERLKVGFSTSHDVLEFQSGLAIAKNEYLKAMTDYIVGVAKLRKIQGTLLEKENIRIADNVE